MDAHKVLERWEIISITQANSHVIRHGSGDAYHGSIGCGDRDAMERDGASSPIGARDGAGGTRTDSEQREVRLERDEEGKGCTGVTLADTVTEGDGTAKEAVNFDTCGRTSEEHAKESDKGGWDAHGC